MENIVNRKQVNITIELDDLDMELSESIQHNTRRYVSICTDAIESLLPKQPRVIKDNLDRYIVDCLNSGYSIPKELLRKFEVTFKALSTSKIYSVGKLKAEHIGKLTVVRGSVTRCTHTKPMVLVATYVCRVCSAETYQPIVSMTFVPLLECHCVDKGRLELLNRGTKFINFREMQIQEHVSFFLCVVFI